MDEEKIDKKIRFSTQSKELLDVFQNHKFSMTFNNAISVYSKLTRLIKVDDINQKRMGEYQFRKLSDPRFTDRRMQGLLRMLLETLDQMTGPQKVIVLWCTVKLR